MGWHEVILYSIWLFRTRSANVKGWNEIEDMRNFFSSSMRRTYDLKTNSKVGSNWVAKGYWHETVFPRTRVSIIERVWSMAKGCLRCRKLRNDVGFIFNIKTLRISRGWNSPKVKITHNETFLRKYLKVAYHEKHKLTTQNRIRMKLTWNLEPQWRYQRDVNLGNSYQWDLNAFLNKNFYLYNIIQDYFHAQSLKRLGRTNTLVINS